MQILRRHKSHAFSLVEVIVALIIAGVVSLSFMGAVIYSLRATASNRQHFLAMQTANLYSGMLAAADFSKLGYLDIDSDAFEYPFIAREGSTLELDTDPDYPDESLSLEVWFEFTGWGTVKTGATDAIIAEFPDGVSDWNTNEWEGHLVTIILSSGLTHVMRIQSNTSNRLELTTDLTGEEEEGLETAIPDGSDFIIDNGKLAKMYVEWGDGTDYRRIVREVMLRRIADEDV